MIRIGVVSDSHGAVDLLEQAVNEMKDVSAIVHLGDCAPDAFETVRRTGRGIITVNGNCDFFSSEPVFRVFELEGKRIYVTHGHKEHVKTGLFRLFYRAEETNADVVLYGHTHLESRQEIENRVFINPGAMRDGKYAVVTIEDGAVDCEFKRIAPGMPQR